MKNSYLIGMCLMMTQAHAMGVIHKIQRAVVIRHVCKDAYETIAFVERSKSKEGAFGKSRGGACGIYWDIDAIKNEREQLLVLLYCTEPAINKCLQKKLEHISAMVYVIN